MLNKLISDNYAMEVENLRLIDSHFGTEIFLLETDKGKYIVKKLPLYMKNIENEGYITDYLYNNGIDVARLLKATNGMYHVKTDELQFHVQEFIDGETLKVNTAPEWFLEKSAYILGKIHNVLKDYGELKTRFGGDFFCESNVMKSKQYYSEQLSKSINNKDALLVFDLEERLKHLERISSFAIDVNKLTYSNSHGDFHIGQIITYDKNLTVIDWTSASRLPICLEVIMAYTTIDPTCRYGKIDSNRLKKYINHYSKYFSLNAYDIQIMPYLLYYQQIICHYSPPYHDVPIIYKPLCELINNFTDWLYENVETLSYELSTL